MQKFLIILFLGLISISSLTASNPDEPKLLVEKTYGPHLLATTFVNSFPGNNNQYFNNWSEGVVLLSNGERVKIKHIRYNCLQDELLWLRPADYQTSTVLKTSVNEFIVFDAENKPCYFKKEKFRDWYMLDSTFVFFHVLVEGDISFYVHHKALNIDKNSRELTRKDFYYIKSGKQLKAIKLRRSSIFNCGFFDKEKMREIIRKNHLRVRKEEDMMKAIDLYNAAS
ncbi:MAG TPA: hypothetical protein PK252_10915 [Bacteroidales bacterium]|nr:hypothetical protein [Bacteroidales bacterium]